MVGTEQWRVIDNGQPYNSSIWEQRSTEDCSVQKFGPWIDTIRFDQKDVIDD